MPLSRAPPRRSWGRGTKQYRSRARNLRVAISGVVSLGRTKVVVMKRRNRYRVTRASHLFFPWVKLWWWPFWIKLDSWGCRNESDAKRECEIHAARDVVWTSDDEGGAS
jgi:hypothetical protein